jgi:hypothetical protein
MDGMDTTTGDSFYIFKLSKWKYLRNKIHCLSHSRSNAGKDISFKPFYPKGHRYTMHNYYGGGNDILPIFCPKLVADVHKLATIPLGGA